MVDGEAGIGKTTLVRAWAGRRAAGGDTVLIASCGPLDRSLPLDAVLTVLAGRLRELGTEDSAAILGADAALLAPLLNLTPGPQFKGATPLLADSMLGPGVLYSALVRALRRLAERAPLVIVIDDAHLASSALADWLRFARREALAAMVVAAIRSGEGEQLPGTAFIHLGALGRDASAELVGPAGAGRLDELYARSKGHPLFLTELAQQASGADLPASLVESVSARCDELGPAGLLLRTAAVIGPELDADLLAAVLGRPVVALLDDAEQAVAKQFLAEQDGNFRFRHELVREALAASATAGRAALLHRQAGRVLDRRADADPLTVAGHARLGGDLALAARALREAAARAAECFDYGAAEALLDDALQLNAEPDGWLARAQVRTLRGRYAEALQDVERAPAGGAAALEVGAWASYFGRDFAQAAQFAADGALAAEDTATRARCLAAGGRTRHAAGDLAQAEMLLGEALSLAEGADRVAAASWLGVLRAHQSRTDEALALLRPAARGRIGVEHTSATMHSLLFTGHAHALAGRPAQALAAFTRYTAEVERRQIPRFAGRAVNFSGWVLRNLGAYPEALDHHHEALEAGRGRPPPTSPSPPSRTWPSTIWRPATSTARRPGSPRPPPCSAAIWSSAGGFGSSTSSSPGGWPCSAARRKGPGAGGRSGVARRRAGRAPVRQRRPAARLPGGPCTRPARGPRRGGGGPRPAGPLCGHRGLAVDLRHGRRLRAGRLAGPGRGPDRSAGPGRGRVRGRPAAGGRSATGPAVFGGRLNAAAKEPTLHWSPRQAPVGSAPGRQELGT